MQLEKTEVSFKSVLGQGFPLMTRTVEILQINMGYLCNQTCEHCHVDAGPKRKEVTSRKVLEACLAFVDRGGVHTVDLTGGAPEMNPEFCWLVEELTKRNVKVIVRSNLTILTTNAHFRSLPQFFKDHGVTIIASLPCYSRENVDKQRGDGVFEQSIAALKRLNELGYGTEQHQLHLVFNPGGASLPPDQAALELAYKQELSDDFGIIFNDLYTITNLPIARFKSFLLSKNLYVDYMSLLRDSFNPGTVDGLMCRNTLSVGWTGDLFDCDFNQMLKLKVAHSTQNILTLESNDLAREVVVGEHCFGCTAGAGSSCQGTLT